MNNQQKRPDLNGPSQNMGIVESVKEEAIQIAQAVENVAESVEKAAESGIGQAVQGRFWTNKRLSSVKSFETILIYQLIFWLSDNL